MAVKPLVGQLVRIFSGEVPSWFGPRNCVQSAACAVHATAPFDHPLYFQSPRPPADWETSYAEAKLFASERAFTLGILEPRERCSRRILVGHLPNRDTYVADTAA